MVKGILVGLVLVVVVEGFVSLGWVVVALGVLLVEVEEAYLVDQAGLARVMGFS